MVELEAVWLLVAVGASGFAVFQGVRDTLRTLASRRAQRHLDAAGLTATAQVVKVEQMQRSLNGAAGHPVTFSFQDAAGQQRYIRDTSGLGGYLVREGSQVVARYSPDDIDLARVEQIAGPQGAYPVCPGGPDHPSLRRAVLELVGGFAVAGVFGAIGPVYLAGDDALDRFGEVILRFLPLIFGLIGLTLLVSAIRSVVGRARRRRRPRAHVGGMVTEVWTAQVGGGGRSQPRTVYPFTVHFVTGDGREVHTRAPAATSGFRPKPDQLVRVHHDREHPIWFEVGEVSGASTAGVVVLVLFAIAFTVAAVFLTVMLGHPFA